MSDAAAPRLEPGIVGTDGRRRPSERRGHATSHFATTSLSVQRRMHLVGQLSNPAAPLTVVLQFVPRGSLARIAVVGD